MNIHTSRFAQVIDEGQQLTPARAVEPNNTLPIIVGIAVSVVVVIIIALIIIRVLRRR